LQRARARRLGATKLVIGVRSIDRPNVLEPELFAPLHLLARVEPVLEAERVPQTREAVARAVSKF
jgi:hypothetical protein